MNQRIQQLALQAGMIKILNEHAAEYGTGTFDSTQYPELAQFAQLIITECIDKVKPTGHHQVWAQSYLGGVDGLDLLYSKIKDIKQHFGVEL